eukprot:TRINITY_DN1871_c0_g1_i1.p2 TRINITY_DN1871_c0_g1~~TRINITY_DN1871_c0_g1_i1.p2  ORF type:complete len:176 (+),score=55.08 TRINITY_DN1871_c0_g1_i1:154-681(+)
MCIRDRSTQSTGGFPGCTMAAAPHTLFVGDLGADVTDNELYQFFQQYYSACHSAAVMRDATSGESYGYGLVWFTDQAEHARALEEMPGQVLGTHPIRVDQAPANSGPDQAHAIATQIVAAAQAGQQQQQQQQWPGIGGEIVTVFVGNLAAGITEDELKQHFGYFGEIVSLSLIHI